MLHLSPDSRRICREKPIACQENVTFIIDASLLQNFDDYKYDDLGSYRNHGYKGYVITLTKDDDDSDDDDSESNCDDDCVIMKVRQHQGNIPSLKSNEIFVRKTYWVHSKVKKFKRRTTEVYLADGKRGDLVCLEYAFDGEPCRINIAPHGNAKTNKRPFIPTASSTRDLIKNRTVGSAAGPSKIFDETFEMRGGMGRMSAVSDVPRDSRQIKYARSKIKQPRKNDELAELIDKANGDSFVCNVQVSPNLRVVIASEEQIQDLKTFCCRPHDFSVLSIDTTYNVSKSSYLTPITYQHMNLLDRKTGCHPHMPGP